MSSVLFLILLGLHLGCTSPKEIIGTWTADKYSAWEKGIAYLKGSRGMVKGKEVILNPDFTYTENYKGRIRKGKWHIENDSLYMKSDDSNSQQKDSLDVLSEVMHVIKPQESFAIKKNKLIKYYSGNYCKRRKSDVCLDFRDNLVVEILKRSE